MFNAVTQSSKFLRLGNLLRSKIQCHQETPLKTFFCTTSEAPKVPNISAITNGDKDLEHKLKVIVLEVDVLRQEGRKVPEDDFLKDKHWKELLELPSLSQRRKYLEYLFKISKSQENRKKKKEERKLEKLEKTSEEKAETFEDFVSKYDLAHNNIFLRIYETTMNQMYNNRLVQAMKFGQKLVVDCGYDKDMTKRENRNCAKQLTLLFAENRSHDDPYDLHFCNIDKNSFLMQTLATNIGTLYEPWFPLNLHETSYLDVFPRDQLVYLTPHCREELTEYDHDAVYIIGGIVDKVNTEPLSLAKAKREGLKMAKLPLDRYLQWGAGSGKSLTINQVALILLDAKLTGDWKYALRHVPRRKVVEVTKESLGAQKVWTPSRKVDFGNLSFKGKSRERRAKVRSLYNE